MEVSATSWSLVQKSPTDCDASCVIKKPHEWGGHGPRWAAAPQGKNKKSSVCIVFHVVCVEFGCVVPRCTTHTSMYELMLTVIRLILSADVQSSCIVCNVGDVTDQSEIERTGDVHVFCRTGKLFGSHSEISVNFPTEVSVMPHFNWRWNGWTSQYLWCPAPEFALCDTNICFCGILHVFVGQRMLVQTLCLYFALFAVCITILYIYWPLRRFGSWMCFSVIDWHIQTHTT